MDVGNRIKQLRELSNFSQNFLANKAGISQTHLRRVELGSADITVGHLELVCDALGISFVAPKEVIQTSKLLKLFS